MNINKINTIGFYGDSFTFGQYLDFYDYGLTECTPINVYGAGINFKTIKCKNGIHHHENHDYPLKEQWLYSVKGTEWNTDHIIYGDWYKRFNSIVERRYSTLVGNKLKVDVISPINNGGVNKSIYLACKEDKISDLKIVMLTHYSRDITEWIKWDATIGDELLIERYYKKVFDKFSKLNNIRFIGSWADGKGSFLTPVREEILLEHQYYKDRLIPLNGYNSIYHLRHSGDKQYSIGEDFPIDDTHPSQELHNIISDSIIQYIHQ